MDAHNTARFEKTVERVAPSIGSSSIHRKEQTVIRISFAGVWVQDQDEALAFYTEKLGWEVRADVTLPELGGYRWLTVGPLDQADVSLMLNAVPGPPVLDAGTADQIRSLMAKGWAGNVLLTTDDAQASYDELRARGVEFTEPPEERPYGIDCAFRDPSGNQFRLTQVSEIALA
jgi:catechol 2,3-dioxygenase-like lactoylglutathione lyase family enzyme